jgi:hypothetical protein
MRSNHSSFVFTCNGDRLLPSKNDVQYEAIWFNSKYSFRAYLLPGNWHLMKNAFAVTPDPNFLILNITFDFYRYDNPGQQVT